MNFEMARTNMVKSQVLPNKIQEPELLGGMNTVARETFVDEPFRDLAYSDYAIPLGQGGRRMLKPLQIAWLIKALQIHEGAKVLVVGAGTGYEATLLARMDARVFALESDAALAERGAALADPAVVWRAGFLEEGWSEEAPFDAILLCGAAVAVPPVIIGQLGRDGRLAAIVGRPGEILMQGVLLRGLAGGDQAEALFETNAYPLPGLEGQAAFQL